MAIWANQKYCKSKKKNSIIGIKYYKIKIKVSEKLASKEYWKVKQKKKRYSWWARKNKKGKRRKKAEEEDSKIETES